MARTSNISFDVAFNVFRNISLFTATDYSGMGVTQQDFELLAQNYTWDRTNIAKVMRTLNCMLHGSCEIIGIRKIRIPSEYVAAVIAAIVHPINMKLACIWHVDERQLAAPAIDLANRDTAANEIEATTSEQMWALCVQLVSHDRAAKIRDDFKIYMGLAEEEAELKERVIQ